jgi:hypothetical protein
LSARALGTVELEQAPHQPRALGAQRLHLGGGRLQREAQLLELALGEGAAA